MKEIIAYDIIEKQPGEVTLHKYSKYGESYQIINDWNKVASYITEDNGHVTHVVWNLPKFTAQLFELLPEEKRKELKEKPRVIYKQTKIFSTERLLGITTYEPVTGNTFRPREANIYGLQRWFSETPTPKGAQELYLLGVQLLNALELLGIEADRLTSPVAVYSDHIEQYDLPTIWSNEDDMFFEACQYCMEVKHHEWRQDFQSTTEPTFNYDIVGAYPYFISLLPNTDKCRIRYSKDYISDADWSIMKGKVKVDGISPIACNLGDNYEFPKKGEWDTYITNKDWLWLVNNNVGSFEMEDGFFFKFITDEFPFYRLIYRLFSMRENGNKIAVDIARKIAQGLSGKFDQENRDGNYGELFNPVYALQTRDNCRLTVGDFIYGHGLYSSLVSVLVDSVKTTREIGIGDSDKLGEWRKKQ